MPRGNRTNANYATREPLSDTSYNFAIVSDVSAYLMGPGPLHAERTTYNILIIIIVSYFYTDASSGILVFEKKDTHTPVAADPKLLFYYRDIALIE